MPLDFNVNDDMLLRFAAENILSFKDAVEFNTFPSSRSHNHSWHKVTCDYAIALRMSAIYGANAAGKSNLLRCIALLKKMIGAGALADIPLREDLYFQLSDDGKNSPCELAVEFFADGHIFYYHIVFRGLEVIREELSLSGKSSDETIFIREGNRVEAGRRFLPAEQDMQSVSAFLDGISRLLRSDMLALSFFGKYYASELEIAKTAYDWFDRLQVIVPSMKVEALPYLLDKDPGFADLVNSIIPELSTGISSLKVDTELITEDDARKDAALNAAYTAARKNPGKPLSIASEDGEIVNLIMEGDIVYRKRVRAVHKSSDGAEIVMDMALESDGTRRLIEYMPLLYSILRSDGVFVVDEIERSIHPIMIKSIMRKISESREARGQIIFTTHESSLLDQNIFRPDEIWFAQKDSRQSTQLYPLSDFNIHNTANIENGYLNGRYGGIPFLSNLKDLKW